MSVIIVESHAMPGRATGWAAYCEAARAAEHKSNTALEQILAVVPAEKDGRDDRSH